MIDWMETSPDPLTRCEITPHRFPNSKSCFILGQFLGENSVNPLSAVRFLRGPANNKQGKEMTREQRVTLGIACLKKIQKPQLARQDKVA